MFSLNSYVQHKKKNHIHGKVTKMAKVCFALNGGKCHYNPQNFRLVESKKSPDSDKKIVEQKHDSLRCLNSKKPFKFNKSASASSTDIWVFEDETTNFKYFLKLHEANPERQPGLYYEKEVYEKITENCRTPEFNEYKQNFVQFCCYLENLTMSNIWSLLEGKVEERLKKNLVRNLKYVLCELDDRPELDVNTTPSTEPICTIEPENRKYNILVTKSPSKHLDRITSLHNFILNPNIKDKHKKNVLARVGLAINAQHRMGISHNDQHWNNILVTISEWDTYIHKDIDGNDLKFGSLYCPVLFDWDRAQMKATPDNKELTYFEHLYTHPYYRKENDYVIFAHNLFKYGQFDFAQLKSIFVKPSDHQSYIAKEIIRWDIYSNITFMKQFADSITFRMDTFLKVMSGWTE